MTVSPDPFDPRGDMDRVKLRKSTAKAKGGQAFLRPLDLAETQDSGQSHRIAAFLASIYNGEAFPFDLFELRTVDEAIGDDMLLCIDALRWGQADLCGLVPDGERRRIGGGKGGDRQVAPQVARIARNALAAGDASA